MSLRANVKERSEIHQWNKASLMAFLGCFNVVVFSSMIVFSSHGHRNFSARKPVPYLLNLFGVHVMPQAIQVTQTDHQLVHHDPLIYLKNVCSSFCCCVDAVLSLLFVSNIFITSVNRKSVVSIGRDHGFHLHL